MATNESSEIELPEFHTRTKSGLPLLGQKSDRDGFSEESSNPVERSCAVGAGATLRLLQFKQPLLEDEFLASLQASNRKPVFRSLVVYTVVMVLEFFLNQIYLLFRYNDAGVHFTLCIRGLALCCMAALLRIAWYESYPFEWVTIWSCCLLSTYLFAINPFRLANIFNSEYFKAHYSTSLACSGPDSAVCYDGDASTLLALSVLLAGTSIAVSVRVCRSWPLASVGLLYLILSLPGIGPMAFRDHIFLFFLFTTLWSLTWCGCYLREKGSRKSWFENRHLRLQVEAQQEAFERQERLLQEVEERLLALGSLNEAASSSSTLLKSARLTRTGTALSTTASSSLVLPIRDLCCPPPDALGSVAEAQPEEGFSEEPNVLLVTAMWGQTSDPARINSMARRIRDPDYSLKEYFEDCVAALPELRLFFSFDGGGRSRTSSGHGAEKEYQRTFGALFCVYWLLRLEIDGKEGFCFGCGDQWEPLLEAVGGETEAKKRTDFLQHMDWPSMAQVVQTAVGDSIERIEAMIVLTGFHDIMKLAHFCPSVSSKHAPYRGYDADATINDHDIALAYVLEHYPDTLPSFRNLPPTMRDVLLFSQNKMHFNHGWFVQAEGPPQAMLSGFKEAAKGAAPADVAFYFFHWLTDLAGAQGTPLGGAEKFVLNFPRPVLASFLWSIPYLQALSQDSETTVVERYLEARYQASCPGQPLPSGPSAVAQLRLVVMAQRGDDMVTEAFASAPSWVQHVLSTEMARTGSPSQRFLRSLSDGGPAFLVYYGPALLQRCSTLEEMTKAVTALAAVYQAGRRLWSESSEAKPPTVQLEIGQLKSMSIDLALSGLEEPDRNVWILRKLNEQEASMELVAAVRLNDLLSEGATFSFVDLSRCQWPEAK